MSTSTRDRTDRQFLAWAGAASSATSSAVRRSWPPPTSRSPRRPPHGAIPTLPGVAELYDLNDFLTDAARPTANLVTITINDDGTASFALPRSENGQGITTSTAMIIAEELELPIDKVEVTLADARPELLFNQLTGGSNTTISTYTPIRVAAAIAKGALLEAAAILLGDEVDKLIAKGGVIQAPSGATATYGELAGRAASRETKRVEVQLKETGRFRVIGTGQPRIDAREAVTGQKVFTTDLQVEGALPTMVCRAPTLNGTVKNLVNGVAILEMPGVEDVAIVDTGVAVRAQTFGQCIDAIREMNVEWNPGPVAGLSDEDIVAELRRAEIPLPSLAELGLDKLGLLESVEADFTFYFRSNSALDTNSAIADVRPDRAEIWAGLKSPITAQARIAEAVGLPQDKVKVHVMPGGGSFGRRLFFDAALEAAKISQGDGQAGQADVAPRRRRPGRAGAPDGDQPGPGALQRPAGAGVHPEPHQHRDRLPARAGRADHRQRRRPAGRPRQPRLRGDGLHAHPGGALQLRGRAADLIETDDRFNTGSMRNIYSPDVRAAGELVVDQLAARIGHGPLRVPPRSTCATTASSRCSTRSPRSATGARRCRRARPRGSRSTRSTRAPAPAWSRSTAGRETVNRQDPRRRDRPAGHQGRCSRSTSGSPINPRGLEAQMQGGINDGIALALTSSMHLRDGHFLEASWDNYFYTRQWNTPASVEVIVMPETTGVPGGAGEAGVAASFAAVACAYARATKTMPTYFPINHRDPLAFTPKPFVPPIPASPTNGLKLTV